LRQDACVTSAVSLALNKVGDNGWVSRALVILGSTGSVGTQALDIVRQQPDRFRVVGLAAGGARPELLAAQALEHRAEVVAVSRATSAEDVQLALYAEASRRGYPRGEFALPKLLAGPEAASEIAGWPDADLVLNGMTGSVGLAPTLAALDAGHTLALANKESLVAGGALVTARAKPEQIVPVDSEHSALAQCLRGGTRAEVRRLVLTASGGPFRGRTRDDLRAVTPAEALAHPTWDMGPVVTLNSATLVNKGLEVIEAHILFGIGYDAIDVVVHPQSIVHSMVEFTDGSTLAQASPPDMHLPIALALAWPARVPGAAAALDQATPATWTFEPVDHETFPAVQLAREVGRRGGAAPAAYNAANEEAVDAFVAGRLPFLGIVDLIAEVVGEPEASAQLTSIDDVRTVEAWARARARELIEKGQSE
jgi:1-deoxy-D-xylulose-5-phosphate reductoisomerase